jgi:hypothetical protein
MHSVAVPATAQLAVKWYDKSTNEASFQLQRCGPSTTATCASFANLARVSSTTATGTGTIYNYTSAALAVGRYYCYRAQACNTANACSAASGALCALTR